MLETNPITNMEVPGRFELPSLDSESRVLGVSFLLYLLVEWILIHHHRKRTFMEIPTKPQTRIEPPSLSRELKRSEDIETSFTEPPVQVKVESELPSKWPPVPRVFTKLPMQIISSTTFFLAIIAVIISYFLAHAALIVVTGSIITTAQPPEIPLVCSLQGQAYTKLTIIGKSMVALIDTGSALTLISESILPEIGNSTVHPSPVPHAQSMSGIFPLIGVIYVDILPVNTVRKCIYVIKKTPYDLVFGTDLLSQPALRPIKIDFLSGVFKLGINSLPLSTNGTNFLSLDNQFTQKVHVLETTFIPPHCKVILNGLPISLITICMPSIFKLNQEKLEKLGLFATRTLVFPYQNSIVPLRLLNTGSNYQDKESFAKEPSVCANLPAVTPQIAPPPAPFDPLENLIKCQ